MPFGRYTCRSDDTLCWVWSLAHREKGDLGSNLAAKTCNYKLLLVSGECKQSIPPFAKSVWCLLKILARFKRVVGWSVFGEVIWETRWFTSWVTEWVIPLRIGGWVDVGGWCMLCRDVRECFSVFPTPPIPARSIPFPFPKFTHLKNHPHSRIAPDNSFPFPSIPMSASTFRLIVGPKPNELNSTLIHIKVICHSSDVLKVESMGNPMAII